jgi:cysteinyl-tRNA synthetase
MGIKIYNTMSRSIEEFMSLEEKKVGIYACGITVYDEAHIGHAMQAVVFDTIRNYFEYCGYDVTYVRNFTDIDDKIIARAIKEKRDPLELSAYYINETNKDLSALNVRQATYEPKVSEFIEEIVRFINSLIKKNKAYESGGDVLFDIKKYPEYGKLSNRNINELKNDDESSYKKNPQDFVLWKGTKPGEPSWDSPWGKGRPGWHIECSAMANRLLGESFDIHGGGLDLIFPHHENEIAQSEALTDKPLAKYWIHNGLVMVNKKKMSKSLGNFYTIKDALKKFGSDEIRYLILSHNYSSNIDFSIGSFQIARKRVFYYYKTLSLVDSLLKEALDREQKKQFIEKSKLIKKFETSMNDNFSSSSVIASLSEEFKEINSLLSGKKKVLLSNLDYIIQFRKDIELISGIIGILKQKPDDYLQEMREKFLSEKRITEEMINDAIIERKKAKSEKNYFVADEIRKFWNNQGINIMDTPDGTTWDLDLENVLVE